MASFDVNHIDFVFGSSYKFYVRNHTKNTGLYYDIGLVVQGSKIDWKSGVEKGVVGPGGTVICNFDLRVSKSQPSRTALPGEPLIDIVGPMVLQTLEESSISLFNVNGTPISLRFWSGGVNEQYINFIGGGSVKVMKDTPTFNEVRFRQYRFTLDSGGHNNDTLDIFFQLYDA